MNTADQIEKYANDHIDKKDKGFGDFMYHAELIRRGHHDIHKKDLPSVDPRHINKLKEILEESVAINKSTGQWSIEKRCWDGYEPTSGKKAYEKGSCQEVKKDDTEQRVKALKDKYLKPSSSTNYMEEKAEQIKNKFYQQESQRIKDPLKVGTKLAAKQTTGPLKKSELELNLFDNGEAELHIGEAVSLEYEEQVVKALSERGYEELSKKEWAPKAEHKSQKGGLTEEGRKSYNAATGGNLKAPQPGGGPRKRSFCARNKGQIDKFNINCQKTPEKRACKARRRWKC
jgi:hypothetical protein